MIGADCNKVARQASENTLRRSGIPVYHVIDGDINCPSDLAAAFENPGIDMRNFFHVRSFLDHNRHYAAPVGYVSGSRKFRTTGVFAIRGAAVAFDGTHEYSDQYIVDLPVFPDCAKEAGLIPDLRYQAEFPASELATVSVNLFVTNTPSDNHPSSRIGRDSKEKI